MLRIKDLPFDVHAGVWFILLFLPLDTVGFHETVGSHHLSRSDPNLVSGCYKTKITSLALAAVLSWEHSQVFAISLWFFWMDRRWFKVLVDPAWRCYCGAALDVPGGSGSELGFKSVSQMLHEITAIITPGGWKKPFEIQSVRNCVIKTLFFFSFNHMATNTARRVHLLTSWFFNLKECTF